MRKPIALVFSACVLFVAARSMPAQTAPSIRISRYHIDLVLNPELHSMSAQAAVTFAAAGNATEVSFRLNPALDVSRVTDADGHPLQMEQSAGSVRVSPATALQPGQPVTWTFTYDGDIYAPTLAAKNASTVGHAGVSLASIGEPVSYLLYAARWLPTTGDGMDRFSASLRVHVPVGEQVFASGATGTPHGDGSGHNVFDFEWTRGGFPGTVIAGNFADPYTFGASGNVRVYLIEGETRISKAGGGRIAVAADKLYDDFRSQFGPLPWKRLNVVEMPDSAVPAASAPGLAAMAGREMAGADPSQLLANTIAHQWWGERVTPATRNDAWITNGMCRDAELESLKKTATPAAFLDAIRNVSASALAYDTLPLSQAAQYPPFSPQFQALSYDKGAMIIRMLRWQIGEAAFQRTLHGILAAAHKPATSAELEHLAEAASHQDLRPFFTQWLDGTGAPTLTDKWTLYRLGDGGTGYRTVGEITEDLDLFRMPVEVRIATKDKTVTRRVEASAPQSQFVVETAEIPQKISLDPDRELLRSGPAMRVRVHILRGENVAARNDDAGAIREYRAALQIDNISSLASYRLGEVYFSEKNYQAAASAFRDALRGDGKPEWTQVWSDVELGKIFDATGQRERAATLYREALQTGDDTGGALELARGYLAWAYSEPGK